MVTHRSRAVNAIFYFHLRPESHTTYGVLPESRGNTGAWEHKVALFGVREGFVRLWLMIIVVYRKWGAEAGAKLVFGITMMTQNCNLVAENLSSCRMAGIYCESCCQQCSGLSLDQVTRWLGSWGEYALLFLTLSLFPLQVWVTCSNKNCYGYITDLNKDERENASNTRANKQYYENDQKLMKKQWKYVWMYWQIFGKAKG